MGTKQISIPSSALELQVHSLNVAQASPPRCPCQCVATGSEIEIITLFLKTALVWKNMGTQTEGEKASKK